MPAEVLHFSVQSDGCWSVVYSEKSVVYNALEGEAEIDTEGLTEIEADGEIEGLSEMDTEGLAEIEADGETEGLAEIEIDGDAEIEADGLAEIDAEGLVEIDADGDAEIEADGLAEIETLGDEEALDPSDTFTCIVPVVGDEAELLPLM